MTNSNNHKSIDATLWEKQASMYKETFLSLLIKFPHLFYQGTENRSIPFVMGLIWFLSKSLFFKATKNKVVFSYGLLWFSRRLFSFLVLKNIRILHLGFLCFMLFNLSTAWAQSAETRAAERQTEIKPLEIGDTIPKQLWNLPLQVVNHATGKDTITLNDYQDKKLIILDFWATWCVPCVKSLTQLDSASAVSGDDLAILPATYEEASVAKSFLDKRKLNLPSIHTQSNESLKRFFPHRMVPHQVWIADGMVKAITGHPQNILTDIAAVLRGETVDMEKKADMIAYDYRKPLTPFTLEADVWTVSHTLSKRLDGVGTMASRLVTDNRQWITFSNYPLIRLYAQSLGLPTNRITVDTGRPKLFAGNSGKAPDNIVCYQLIAPKDYTDSRTNDYIVRSLNLDLGLCGKWDSIEMDCWIIRESSEKLSIDSLVQPEKQMITLADLLDRYNNKIAGVASPIYINETTGKMLVKDEFSLADLNDPTKMEQMLSRYGIQIAPAKRKLPVYRIQDMTDIQSINQQK
ncbi:TlpA family protein disulfide reductase [Sphingobacterium sp. DN00404]|uniref:TlpA family protein disulfide reductase n=1 Tax=Sphingobacterium micropteri TaxID=2763501 RepID=A0ABR7YQE3_9SPHI|nr:TlpA disulfide reductase family protein [Sphingobacterium micropteri]MBD1433525.1 TlpA family protein disulfide reductase [Sphingobacterium micropteri]